MLKPLVPTDFYFYRGRLARNPKVSRAIMAGNAKDTIAQMTYREGRWMAYKLRVTPMGSRGDDEQGNPLPRVDVTDIADDPAAIMARLA
jgi:hypothetical protein